MPGALLLVGDDPRELEVEFAALPGARVFPRRGSDQRVRGANEVAVDDEDAGLDARRRVRVRLRAPSSFAPAEVAVQRDCEQHTAHGRRKPRPRACPGAPRPRPGAGSSAPIVGRPCSASVRPTSSAKSGLPSVASAIRRTSCRGNVSPSRSRQEMSDRAEAERRRPRAARGSAGRAPARAWMPCRAYGSGGTPRSCRQADGRRRRAPRRRADRATGRRRSRRAMARARRGSAARSGSRLAAASGAVEPSGSSRRSATWSARACGAAKPLSSATSMPSSRSISAGERETLGAAAARDEHAHRVLAAPASTPASQRVVLPMPGPPVRRRAWSGRPVSRKRLIAASSVSRPMTADCPISFTPTLRLIPRHRGYNPLRSRLGPPHRHSAERGKAPAFAGRGDDPVISWTWRQ